MLQLKSCLKSNSVFVPEGRLNARTDSIVLRDLNIILELIPGTKVAGYSQSSLPGLSNRFYTRPQKGYARKPVRKFRDTFTFMFKTFLFARRTTPAFSSTAYDWCCLQPCVAFAFIPSRRVRKSFARGVRPRRGGRWRSSGRCRVRARSRVERPDVVPRTVGATARV